MTTSLHLDDFLTFSSLNDFITGEHQLDSFDIFLTRKRMDLEKKTYLPYEKMSSRELDSYYFYLN